MSEGQLNGIERTGAFSRNAALEALLEDINSNLWPSEEALVEHQTGVMPYPLILVMGAMRSGTTLFMQWLANTGVVAYPTNLLSRFYGAPIIGAKIQLLLTDPRFNFRNELGEFLQQVDYRSENGKTKGALAPNEFWYFWRRFLADPNRDVWTDDELRETMDVETLKAELAGVMRVFEKPFAAKGLLFNYNIPFLNSVFDKILFIYIKRDPLMNIQSVLEARKRQLGSVEKWYSFEIPEKREILNLSPVEQAAAQVACIHRAVEKGFQQVSSERKLFIKYEDFCSDPCKCFEKIAHKLGIQGTRIHHAYKGPLKFDAHNKLRLERNECLRALETYSRFQNRD